MPRYFFHVVDHAASRDDDGLDLPDLATARSAAVRYAGELLATEPHLLDHSGVVRVQVTGIDDAMLFTIRIAAEDCAP